MDLLKTDLGNGGADAKNTDFNFSWIQDVITDQTSYKLLEFTSNVNPTIETEIAHDLGRLPTQFYQVDNENGGVIYRGDSAWTDKKVYFKSTVANNAVKVRIM